MLSNANWLSISFSNPTLSLAENDQMHWGGVFNVYYVYYLPSTAIHCVYSIYMGRIQVLSSSSSISPQVSSVSRRMKDINCLISQTYSPVSPLLLLPLSCFYSPNQLPALSLIIYSRCRRASLTPSSPFRGPLFIPC